MECIECKEQFQSKKISGTFCSDTCRGRRWRRTHTSIRKVEIKDAILYTRGCIYCSATITTKNIRKVYCSNVCRAKASNKSKTYGIDNGKRRKDIAALSPLYVKELIRKQGVNDPPLTLIELKKIHLILKRKQNERENEQSVNP